MANLVFIGDSLTQWCNWEKRLPGHSALNLGLAGETVQGLLARRERIRTAIENPDFVFLMTGINNLALEHGDIVAPYREIVRNLTIWFKRAHIVVESILPVSLEGIGNDAIIQTNRALEQIAAEYNADYLDLYALFTDVQGAPKNEYLQPDGVHVSEEGYKAWSEAVIHFIQSQAR